MDLDKSCDKFESMLINNLAQIYYQTGEDLTPDQQKAVMRLALKAFREYIQYCNKED